jgi:hypothetical protein
MPDVYSVAFNLTLPYVEDSGSCVLDYSAGILLQRFRVKAQKGREGGAERNRILQE